MFFVLKNRKNKKDGPAHVEEGVSAQLRRAVQDFPLPTGLPGLTPLTPSSILSELAQPHFLVIASLFSSKLPFFECDLVLRLIYTRSQNNSQKFNKIQKIQFFCMVDNLLHEVRFNFQTIWTSGQLSVKIQIGSEQYMNSKHFYRLRIFLIC